MISNVQVKIVRPTQTTIKEKKANTKFITLWPQNILCTTSVTYLKYAAVYQQYKEC